MCNLIIILYSQYLNIYFDYCLTKFKSYCIQCLNFVDLNNQEIISNNSLKGKRIFGISNFIFNVAYSTLSLLFCLIILHVTEE